MSELTEFILERVSEDEDAARAAIDQAARRARYHEAIADALPFPVTPQESARMVGAVMRVADSEHDPARVLAECEAKRRIVELHEPGHECVSWDRRDKFFDAGEEWSKPCPVLRLLALPYAGHPDYREEWKP